MGNDTYWADRRTPWENAVSFGGATIEPMYYTFRDETLSVGIFLDTAGHDTYDVILPDDEEAISKFIPLKFGDSSEWWHEDGPMVWGYGLDVDWFEGFLEVAEE